MWITNGTIADLAVVWAKLNDEVRGFLVEKGTQGFFGAGDKAQAFLARFGNL